VIHRDIKPANLLMTSTGGVKVADFGIATDADRLCLTRVGLVVGTLAYLAPERLQGARATVQSDIYSAGVVLYEMLTGNKPFVGETPAALLDQISNGAAVDISSHGGDIDPTVAGVVMRALAKDPAARYPSAAAMAHDLDKSRPTNLPPSLPPPPPTSVILPAVAARPPDRRGRSVIAAVLAALIVVLIVAALASRGDQSPFPPAQATSPASTAPAVPPSTTVVTTTVRPATTRAPVTTTRATNGKGKTKDNND
jgi:serine/threonine-protein kinase